MKKTTDFAEKLAEFLTDYLPRQKGASSNTVKSYRDTFKLFLTYSQDVAGISPDRLTLAALTAELVKGFLEWLQKSRNCGASTRNQRLAAIHSFLRFAQCDAPESLLEIQKILSIPAKKTKGKVIEAFSPDAMKALLAQPDAHTFWGLRDLALLSLLYDSGARVQELIDASCGDFVGGDAPTITLTGKGGKKRRVPLMANTGAIVERYVKEAKLNVPGKRDHPLFYNHRGNKLTREGIAYILRKYAAMAQRECAEVPERVHCHMTRHSKGMDLLRAGVNIVYIRDFLGHADVETTQIYARADSETKRKAIEEAYPELEEKNLPDWKKDADLMTWLNSLERD